MCFKYRNNAIRCNHNAIRYNHMQSGAIRCNHMQSHAIRCNHMQSHATSLYVLYMGRSKNKWFPYQNQFVQGVKGCVFLAKIRTKVPRVAENDVRALAVDQHAMVPQLSTLTGPAPPQRSTQPQRAKGSAADGMDLWVVCGECVGSVWVVCGECVGCVWVVCG
jgi:hypothetical protein